MDDDPAEYKEKHNGLYLVDCKTGLTDADVKKIRKLISRMQGGKYVKIIISYVAEYFPSIERIIAAKTKEEPENTSIADRLDKMREGYVTEHERNGIVR